MKTAMVNINAVPKLKITNVLKALLIALIATVLLVAVLSALLTWTGLPEGAAGIGIIIIIILSNIIGGISLAKKMRANGMMGGVLLGLVYAVAIYLLGCIFYNKVDININTLIMLIASVVSGGIGGIMGVNSKKGR